MCGSILRQYCLAAGCMLAWAGLVTPVFAQEASANSQASFSSFQVPGCSSTYPVSINRSLSVTGSCSYGFVGSHGFVRDGQGAVTVFDPPASIGTYPAGINAAGAIAGYFQDSSLVQHGFIRSPDGTLTVFDFPSTFGGRVTGINSSGTTTGYYSESDGQQHGFVRAPDGTIISFDPPGASETFADGINDRGTIVGTYLSSDGGHGFLRHPNGELTLFSPPPSSTTFITLPGYSINASGTVAGTYSDPASSDGNATRGFVRLPQGTNATFNPEGGNTSALSINTMGAVTGYYEDAGAVQHGFVRSKHGTIVSFDYPGATSTTGISINDLGVIAGSYNDSAGVTSGFVRLPPSDGDDNKFQSGSYALTEADGLYVDGGFYLYGDRTVRLWVYVTGNPSQHWTFTKVPGGYTILNQGTSQYASDGGGQLMEGSAQDIWTVTAAPEGYTIKNNRTGLFLTDPAVQDGAITLTGSGSVWQFSTP